MGNPPHVWTIIESPSTVAGAIGALVAAGFTVAAYFRAYNRCKDAEKARDDATQELVTLKAELKEFSVRVPEGPPAGTCRRRRTRVPTNLFRNARQRQATR
jgi:hypothetical protein